MSDCKKDVATLCTAIRRSSRYLVIPAVYQLYIQFIDTVPGRPHTLYINFQHKRIMRNSADSSSVSINIALK